MKTITKEEVEKKINKFRNIWKKNNYRTKGGSIDDREYLGRMFALDCIDSELKKEVNSKYIVMLRLFLNMSVMVLITFSYIIGIFFVWTTLNYLGFLNNLMSLILFTGTGMLSLWFFWELIHIDFTQVLLDIAELLTSRMRGNNVKPNKLRKKR